MLRSTRAHVVSERLLGIPRSLALFGLVGLAVALALYGRGLGISLPRYELSKAAIVARGDRVRRRVTGPTRAARRRSRQSYSGSTAHFRRLVARYGIGEVREPPQRRIASCCPRGASASARRYSRHDIGEDRQGLDVTLDERGGVLWRPSLRSAAVRAHAPKRDEAAPGRGRAPRAMGFDLTGFAERNRREDAAPSRSRRPRRPCRST
jgi:hypothetical protein